MIRPVKLQAFVSDEEVGFEVFFYFARVRHSVQLTATRLPAQVVRFRESIFDQAGQRFHNFTSINRHPTPGSISQCMGQDYLIDVLVIIANSSQHKQPYELASLHVTIAAHCSRAALPGLFALVRYNPFDGPHQSQIPAHERIRD